MNGLLHLGHAFSLSKVQCTQPGMPVMRGHKSKMSVAAAAHGERHTHAGQPPAVLLQLVFASGYHKLVGKQVLFPQGFHCTGMPIKVGPAVTLHLAQTLAADDHPQRLGSSNSPTLAVTRLSTCAGVRRQAQA